MKQHFLITVSAMLFLTGCIKPYDKINTTSFIQRMSELGYITPCEIKNTSIWQQYEKLFLAEQYTGLAYIADGSCSICIGRLIKFYSRKNELNCSCPLKVITEHSYVDIISYYIGCLNETDNTKISIDSLDGIGSSYYDLNGICIDVIEGKVRNVFFYNEF
ncbi:MAG: hypothetical protein Q4E48_02985 [Prevotella sp.]|nr:hypothetical protein [Prevotella sp.]